ncbi:MAG TPA: methyl-accepting chemotaxis protein, partial [Pseudomonas sp.]|nr:methyl-accepting chemotaxis protein [Pseudomonas sp.]
MSRGFALEHLTVRRKLGLGFGLLLAFAVLLALTGLYALRSDGQSLKRINRLGNLFDQTVFSRDANFVYALTADATQLTRHDASLGQMEKLLAGIVADVHAGQWPQEDLAKIRRLDDKLRAYMKAHDAVEVGVNAGPTVLKLNADLAALQDEINVLYDVEAVRAKRRVEAVVIVLGSLTLLALLFGGLLAWRIGRQIVAPLQQTLEAAERIANGDLTVELHSERADELGQLLRSINHMSHRLRDVMALIGGSSHRLA